MADEWKEYVKDPRTVCKYSPKCYQKNPDHHKKFKHPPQNKITEVNRNKRRFSPYTRDSPRHSCNSSNKDELPNNNSEKKPEGSEIKTKASNSKESNAEVSNSQESKAEATSSEESKTEASNCDESKSEELMAVELPEHITFYDKNTQRSIFMELFLVEMPEDFFKFYECISDYGKSVEDTLASVNLIPIGPYELLLGKLPKLENKELYLIHWRFFYDPPEFQAILKKKKKNSEYHIGYFRDDPKQKPVFVASNDSEKDYLITPMAVNIFGAIYVYLQKEKKHSPFTAMSCQKLMDKIKKYTEEHNISLEEYSMKQRIPHIVTRSFHGAGIVVPYNKKTQIGYRSLVETDANLRKLFSSLEKATNQNDKHTILAAIQPVITYASIAVDECDFGTSLEAGIALFCSGLKELEPSALSSLTVGYKLLNREAFSDIIKAHLKYRRRGSNMSLLSLKK